MSWWAWILFWCVFWACALGYLAWRTWRLWPHARDFGRTCSTAFERIEEARNLAEQGTNRPGSPTPKTSRSRSTRGAEPARQSFGASLATVDEVRSADGGCPSDDLAWNVPASEWRARRAAARRRRRELRLDDHTAVWATWRDPLD